MNTKVETKEVPMMTLYLVTGGFGHLGYTVATQLLEQEKNVLLFDVAEKPYLKNMERLKIAKGDIRNKDDLEKLFAMTKGKRTFVIHCAGLVSIKTKEDRLVDEVNVTGTANIVEFCMKYNVEKLIYVGSVHAIREKPKGTTITEPSTYYPSQVKGQYARTKAKATLTVMNSVKKGLKAVVVHPSGIIGPNDFGIGHTTRLFVDYTKGKLTAAVKGCYDFVDVRDVSNGILLALEKGRIGEAYILSNRVVTIKELLDTLALLSGKKPIHTFLPLWFIKPLAPIAELYYRARHVKPLFTPYSLRVLDSNPFFSHEKATRELGYRARPLQSTISDTLQWIEENL